MNNKILYGIIGVLLIGIMILGFFMVKDKKDGNAGGRGITSGEGPIMSGDGGPIEFDPENPPSDMVRIDQEDGSVMYRSDDGSRTIVTRQY